MDSAWDRKIKLSYTYLSPYKIDVLYGKCIVAGLFLMTPLFATDDDATWRLDRAYLVPVFILERIVRKLKELNNDIKTSQTIIC